MCAEEVEADRKKYLTPSNIKYYKATVHYLFEKVINKIKIVIMKVDKHH
jgi:hypothetical protein